MEVFAEYLARLENPRNRVRLEELFAWIMGRFPELKPRIAWNQPMFTDHETFIIGFSAAKRHLAVAPERAGVLRFADDIAQAGYSCSKELIRIPWDHPLQFALLEDIIAFNISDKASCSTFWRKQQSEASLKD